MNSASWKWTFGLLLLVSSGTARAQFYPGQGYPAPFKPAVTPYLNLLRGTSNVNSLTLNYWNLVQPQQQLFGATGQLQQQFAGFQQQFAAETQATQAQLQAGVLPPTGHGFGFMTQSKYFMNLRGGYGGAYAGANRFGLAGPGTGIGARPLGGSFGTPAGYGTPIQNRGIR